MARLPSECYLMQRIGGNVILFEDGSEREIVRFDPADSMDAATALEIIMDSELGDEDRSFACFWAGYFHAYAVGPDEEMVRNPNVTEAGGVVIVTDDRNGGGAEIVRFASSDGNAAARAQKAIHDSVLIPNEQGRANFWSGYFYAHASGL